MNAVDLDSIKWLSPREYPTRPTFELNMAVARDIVLGAAWRTVAKKYGIYARFRDWMLWGYQAACRDANENDHHALFLDFYLKVGQAMGIAETDVQHRMYIDYPQWWLVRNPETTGDWAGARDSGAVIPGESIMIPAAATVVDPTENTGQGDPLAPSEIGDVLRTLIRGGAAVPSSRSDADDTLSSASNTIVDADTGAEGTGTDDLH